MEAMKDPESEGSMTYAELLASCNAGLLRRPESPYGHCPQCGAPGVTRERRPNGNDTCEAGHVYPSANAANQP